MRRYPQWNSPHRLAAEARYTARVEEITGVKARKDQLERDYIKAHGHGFIPGHVEWREAGTPMGTPMSVVHSPREALGVVTAKEAASEDSFQPWTPERTKSALESKASGSAVERKAFTSYSTKATGQSGVVEAIVSVSGNEDLGGDIVQPNALGVLSTTSRVVRGRSTRRFCLTTPWSRAWLRSPAES